MKYYYVNKNEQFNGDHEVHTSDCSYLPIIVLITVILIFQFRVFSQAKSKISLFKNMMPEQHNFSTIKIYVREDEIEKITLSEIFDEIDQYKSDDFERRDRRKLLKEKIAQKKKEKSKNEETSSEKYINTKEGIALNKTNKEVESYEGNNKEVEEINKVAEGIIQSIKQNSKRNLFED